MKRHYTAADRDIARAMRAEKVSVAAIARALDRNPANLREWILGGMNIIGETKPKLAKSSSPKPCPEQKRFEKQVRDATILLGNTIAAAMEARQMAVM